MSELTHAIVLLAHFHALCSAVFGCGVNFELDDSAGRLLHSDGESGSDSDQDSSTVSQTEHCKIITSKIIVYPPTSIKFDAP